MVKKYNMLRVQSVGFWIQSCQVIGKARRLFREKFNRNDFHLVTTTEDDLSIEELAKWRTAKTRKKNDKNGLSKNKAKNNRFVLRLGTIH